MLTRETYRNGYSTREIDWDKLQDISITFACASAGILCLSGSVAFWVMILSY